MGFVDSLVSYLPFIEEVEAESPAKTENDSDTSAAELAIAKEPATEQSEPGKEAEDEAGQSTEEEKEEEEDEEEEEEAEDPKAKLEEECINSNECKTSKTHYDHCAHRVEEQIEKNGKPSEDCVEEFFHLAHCATQCAAPQLWRVLK